VTDDFGNAVGGGTMRLIANSHRPTQRNLNLESTRVGLCIKLAAIKVLSHRIRRGTARTVQHGAVRRRMPHGAARCRATRRIRCKMTFTRDGGSCLEAMSAR